MEPQTKPSAVATPDEAMPGIENVETLAEWQALTDRRWGLAGRKAQAKKPMYVSHYGHSMRYWPHDGRVGVQFTQPVAEKLGRKPQEKDEIKIKR